MAPMPADAQATSSADVPFGGSPISLRKVVPPPVARITPGQFSVVPVKEPRWR